jgi:hypothetical protein
MTADPAGQKIALAEVALDDPEPDPVLTAPDSTQVGKAVGAQGDDRIGPVDTHTTGWRHPR